LDGIWDPLARNLQNLSETIIDIDSRVIFMRRAAACGVGLGRR
jgi:hypothetical protein